MSQNFQPQRFDVLPTITKNILIINGLFFLGILGIGTRFDIDLIQILGLRYPGSDAFGWWQPVTHLFMHGSWGHLIFNMFSFWMFGSVLEQVWGERRFLQFYLITGLGAAFLHYVMVYLVDIGPALHILQLQLTAAEQSGNSQMAIDTLRSMENVRSIHNIIGASGAVAGVWMAFAYLFPNSSLYLFFFIHVKAKYLALIYFLIELTAALKFDSEDDIAHFAHLGGMLMGLIMVHYVYRRDRTQFY